MYVASNSEIRQAIGIYYKGENYAPEQELKIPEEFNIFTSDKRTRTLVNLEAVSQSQKRILLLEPDLDISRSVINILKKEGVPHVKWVSSTADARYALQAEAADILLANGRDFREQGSWIRELGDGDLPEISYYDLRSMFLGQEHPYDRMSETLLSMVSLMVGRSLKKHEAQRRKISSRVRYCKLLAMKLGLNKVQADGLVLAAWLSGSEMGKFISDHMVSPYHLNDILKTDIPLDGPVNRERSILNLVIKYQQLKKDPSEPAESMDAVRKELVSEKSSIEEKAMIEAFLQVVKQEAYLQSVDQPLGRILLVDPGFRKDSQLALRLTNEGYDVIGVGDADQAVKQVMDVGVELILSEVGLPGSDGLRLCRALRENSASARIPFFFLTGEKGDRLAAECLEAGADDFFAKPADEELLLLKIRNMINLKRPAKERSGISGTLSDMSGTDLIQSLTIGDKDVEITLQNNGRAGSIYIQEGEIIHADSEGLDGEAAFYRLMSWQKGDFEIVSCSDFPARTIHGSAMSLLMEAARLADEVNLEGEMSESSS